MDVTQRQTRSGFALEITPDSGLALHLPLNRDIPHPIGIIKAAIINRENLILCRHTDEDDLSGRHIIGILNFLDRSLAYDGLCRSMTIHVRNLYPNIFSNFRIIELELIIIGGPFYSFPIGSIGRCLPNIGQRPNTIGIFDVRFRFKGASLLQASGQKYVPGWCVINVNNGNRGERENFFWVIAPIRIRDFCANAISNVLISELQIGRFFTF